MKALALTAASLLLCSAAAMAQTQPGQNPSQPGTMAGSTQPPLRQDIMNSLKQAGFSDVHVAPDSFFVHAKDKSGNPIAMMVGPGSVTELVDVNGGSGNGGGASNNGGGASNPFVSNAANDMLGSKLIGTEVRDSANQSIGSIKDVAVKNGQVQAYILSVGGFLGVGTRYVAVSPQALNFSNNGNGNNGAPQATMNTTKQALQNAPQFNYSNG